MNRIKKAAGIFLLTGILLSAGSWGFLVHKTTHQLAVYELPQTMQHFFYKNMNYLVYNSVAADVRRNKDRTEAPKHFIDLEVYGDSAAWKMPMSWNVAVKKYSKDTLIKYGYLPYHIIVMQQKLTKAFKSKNADSILFYAANLGHYIEDANVPLHTSVNYNGQLTNQKGLHALWETVVPEVEIANYTLSTKHSAAYLKDPQLAIWKAIRISHTLLPSVFAKEKEVSKHFTQNTKYRLQTRKGKEVKYYTTAFAKAYSNALKPTINQQLLRSANMVADFWYTAWVDAGRPKLDNLLKQHWNSDDKKKFRTELRCFKQNTLVKDNLLRSAVSIRTNF